MKHKVIFGTMTYADEFEEKLNEFRKLNKVSGKHFIVNGMHLCMLYEYTPKSPSARNDDVSGTTKSKDAETGTSGEETINEGGATS